MIKSNWFSVAQIFAYCLSIVWSVVASIRGEYDSAMLALLWALIIKTDFDVRK